jgi:hypothetical protein
MSDIDISDHTKKVNNLVSHKLRVLLRRLLHKFVSTILKVLQLLILMIILANAPNQNHDLNFSPLPQLLIDLCSLSITSIANSLTIFGLNEGLDVDDVFGQFYEGEHFELLLVEKLAVALRVADRAEGLLLVHFVLLDRAYYVLLVFV